MKYLNCGIYEIKNITTNNRYIGSSCNLNKRFRVHKIKLNNSEHHARYLQRSWNKYGADSFEFNVLLYCDKEFLLIYEQLFLDKLQPVFNACLIAGNCLGIKHTEEARRNMAMSHIGNRNSVGNKGCVGRVLSDETKKKISQSNLGKKVWLGRKHTEETKEKIRLSRIGKSAWNKGKKIPIISKQKIEYWKNWRIERGLQPDQIIRNMKKSERRSLVLITKG